MDSEPTVNLREAYEGATRRVQRVLGANVVAVIERRLPMGLRIVRSTSGNGLDPKSLVSPAHVDLVAQTGRTLNLVQKQSTLVVPIIGDGRFVAALVVVRKNLEGFSDTEVSAIESLGRELGGFAATTPPPNVAGARRDTLMELLGLSGTSDPASDSTAEDSSAGATVVLGPILKAHAPDAAKETLLAALDNVGGHLASIIQAGDTRRMLGVAVTDQAPELSARELVSETVVSEVLETGLPLLTLHAGSDENLASESLMGIGVSTVLCVPLAAATGKTVGVLYVVTFRSHGRIAPDAVTRLMSELRGFGRVLAELPD